MARYIDADNFRKTMIKRFGCVPCLTDYSEASRHDIPIDDALNLAPTADVAPRAEVARLEREIQALVAFKEYFSDLYGHGLAIANFHENGALEDFDDFYDAAEEEYESVVGGYAKKS